MTTEVPRIKRIVLTGAESTGKSTLAKSLSEHYRAPWSKEFAREYVHSVGRDLLAAPFGTLRCCAEGASASTPPVVAA